MSEILPFLIHFFGSLRSYSSMICPLICKYSGPSSTSTTPKNLWNPKVFVTSMMLWWYNCWQEITYFYKWYLYGQDLQLSWWNWSIKIFLSQKVDRSRFLSGSTPTYRTEPNTTLSKGEMWVSVQRESLTLLLKGSYHSKV